MGRCRVAEADAQARKAAPLCAWQGLCRSCRIEAADFSLRPAGWAAQPGTGAGWGGRVPNRPGAMQRKDVVTNMLACGTAWAAHQAATHSHAATSAANRAIAQFAQPAPRQQERLSAYATPARLTIAGSILRLALPPRRLPSPLRAGWLRRSPRAAPHCLHPALGTGLAAATAQNL
jgi:hypothetical protein